MPARKTLTDMDTKQWSEVAVDKMTMYARCPKCNQETRLRKDGRLFKHETRPYSGRTCRGSGGVFVGRDPRPGSDR